MSPASLIVFICVLFYSVYLEYIAVVEKKTEVTLSMFGSNICKNKICSILNYIVIIYKQQSQYLR